MDSAKLSRVYKEASQQLTGNDATHSAVGIGLFNHATPQVRQPHTHYASILFEQHPAPSCQFLCT